MLTCRQMVELLVSNYALSASQRRHFSMVKILFNFQAVRMDLVVECRFEVNCVENIRLLICALSVLFYEEY